MIGAINIAGLPAISVLCGFAKEKNLLIGIQFATDVLREDVCIQSAATFQSATDWHSKPPGL